MALASPVVDAAPPAAPEAGWAEEAKAVPAPAATPAARNHARAGRVIFIRTSPPGSFVLIPTPRTSRQTDPPLPSGRRLRPSPCPSRWLRVEQRGHVRDLPRVGD